MRHVLALEPVGADAAVQGRRRQHQSLVKRSRQVKATARDPCQQWRQQQGDKQRYERGERRRPGSEHAAERRDRNNGCNQGGADTHRIDVGQIGPPEFDVRWAQAERLVDDEIGDQCPDPGDSDTGVQAKHLFQGLK